MSALDAAHGGGYQKKATAKHKLANQFKLFMIFSWFNTDRCILDVADFINDYEMNHFSIVHHIRGTISNGIGHFEPSCLIIYVLRSPVSIIILPHWISGEPGSMLDIAVLLSYTSVEHIDMDNGVHHKVCYSWEQCLLPWSYRLTSGRAYGRPGRACLMRNNSGCWPQKHVCTRKILHNFHQGRHLCYWPHPLIRLMKPTWINVTWYYRSRS